MFQVISKTVAFTDVRAAFSVKLVLTSQTFTGFYSKVSFLKTESGLRNILLFMEKRTEDENHNFISIIG